MRVRLPSLAFVGLLAVFAIAAAVFLAVIGQDALNDRHPFRFYADSNTYHQTYAGDADNFGGDLVAVNANYLGPLAILHLLGGNIYLVMLLNVYLFCHSIIRITALLKLDPSKVGLLLLLSPITVSSLLSVNKEILIYPFIALALTGYVRGSAVAIVLALAVSLLTRWQLTLVYLVLLFFSMRTRLVGRGKAVVLLLLALSVAYVAIQDWLEPVIAYVEASIESYDEGGSGLFEATLNLQKEGLYFLVFPVKAAHLLFGMAFRLDRIFFPVEIYDDFFIRGHCAVSLVLLLALARRRLLSLRSDLVFATLVFLAIFCLTPIFAPRYLYPAFILGVLVLCGAPARLPRFGRARPNLRLQTP